MECVACTGLLAPRFVIAGMAVPACSLITKLGLQPSLREARPGGMVIPACGPEQNQWFLLHVRERIIVALSGQLSLI